MCVTITSTWIQLIFITPEGKHIPMEQSIPMAPAPASPAPGSPPVPLCRCSFAFHCTGARPQTWTLHSLGWCPPVFPLRLLAKDLLGNESVNSTLISLKPKSSSQFKIQNFFFSHKRFLVSLSLIQMSGNLVHNEGPLRRLCHLGAPFLWGQVHVGLVVWTWGLEIEHTQLSSW